MTSVLESLPSRLGWERAPFGRLVTRSKTSGRGDLPPLSVYLEDGVVPRSSRDDNHNRLGEDASKYLVVQPGDIVFNKLRTWQGGLGVSRYEGTVSPAYYVCRPQPSVEPRFLHYLLKSRPYLAELTRVSKFMPPSQFDILWDDLREIPVVHPALRDQRAIADYLDIETARIDALINKKQQLRIALRERYASVVRLELGYDEGIKLKHLLAAPLAYGVLVPSHDPEGIPMLRITDLRTGTVDLDSVNRIPESLSTEFRRTILRAGDVVVSVVGTLGRSLEVTPQLVGANLNRALARVQLKHDVPRALIRLWFQSDDFQLQARLATSGDSAQPTLGLGDMKNFEIGIPMDSSRWAEIADRMLHRLAPIEQAEMKLQDQERLLVEHRQALITTAATGELGIPGVAS